MNAVSTAQVDSLNDLCMYIYKYIKILYIDISKKKVAEKIAEEIKTEQGNVVADRKVCPNYYKISMQRCRPLILHAHAYSKTHIYFFYVYI